MATVSIQKKIIYIYRNHDILTVEQNKNIYNLIRRTIGSKAIRENMADTNGVYIDLNEIKNEGIIDTIYTMIKTRKEEIKL